MRLIKRRLGIFDKPFKYKEFPDSPLDNNDHNKQFILKTNKHREKTVAQLSTFQIYDINSHIQFSHFNFPNIYSIRKASNPLYDDHHPLFTAFIGGCLLVLDSCSTSPVQHL